MSVPRRPSRLLSAYRAATGLAAPLAGSLLKRRLASGKEDAERLPERLGHPGRVRPKASIVWIHAASVGESVSVLPVIRDIERLRPDVRVLVTTGTVTSSRLMGERLPAHAFHQFAPVDTPDAVRAFLDYWKPSLALWVESELWPNMLHETRLRQIPLVLINARMSDKSFRGWTRAPAMAGEMLGAFDLCLAQDEGVAEKLRVLGARRVETPGNLKLVGDPLPFDAPVLGGLRGMIGDRRCLLLASSHEGEEQLAAFTHRDLAQQIPGLLTVMVPRHPQRGAQVARSLAPLFRVGLRSAGERPTAETDIYVADTIGELGVFYRLASLAVLGGSFVPHGGQNPLEPARLGVAVLSGPHIGNFRDIYRLLVEAGAAEVLAANDRLTQRTGELLRDELELSRRGQAAARAAGTREPLTRTMDLLVPYLRTLDATADA